MQKRKTEEQKIINLVVELRPVAKRDRYMTLAAGFCREILYGVIHRESPSGK